MFGTKSTICVWSLAPSGLGDFPSTEDSIHSLYWTVEDQSPTRVGKDLARFWTFAERALGILSHVLKLPPPSQLVTEGHDDRYRAERNWLVAFIKLRQ
jgi:hypothetical protein